MIAILLLTLKVFGQTKVHDLVNNSGFVWMADSLEQNVILYYEKNSYAAQSIEVLRKSVKHHLISTMEFIGVESYDKSIHYFIVEERESMKLLIGFETNGFASPKRDFITAIYSDNIKSVYSNHELFHLMAMNLWGNPEIWINEGMAVYADNTWNGYDLHELSKYLIDQDKFVSIPKIAKSFKKYDAMLTYPLLGSFAKFIDETYGRETVKLCWTKGRRGLKKQLGKSLHELEEDWLIMLKSVTYKDIKYMN
jgi:hypothetical protein